MKWLAVTEECLYSFWVFNKTQSLCDLTSFFSEGSLFQQSHFVCNRTIFWWTQIKKWSCTIQEIEREMIYSQCWGLCLHQESWFQQSEWSGREAQVAKHHLFTSGRDKHFSDSLLLNGCLVTAVRAGSCCAGETYNCLSPSARPYPVCLHAQLSNTPKNSAQP